MSLSIGELVGFVDLDTSAGEKSADRFGSLLEKVGGSWGKVLAGAGAAGGLLFAGSLMGAANLDQLSDHVAAALDLTEKQAARVGKAAGNVYANGWGESTGEVTDAIESVMSSIKGLRNASQKDLEAITTKALTFASVMGVDVGRAAQVAGNMINNGMAKNATQAFDLLTRTSSKVPKELREDILDATDEYGQFFNTLGIDGPHAMDLLAKGAAKGMYGIDKAGDAIKEFTIRSTDMSASSKAAYKAIGLDAHKMATDILAGGEKSNKAFNRVVSGILSIKDPAKRSNTAIALFGTQMEDLGVKDVPKFLRSLQTSGKGLDRWRGATARAGKTLGDNASTNIETFKRKIQLAFINTLGSKVLPVVNQWASDLNNNAGPAIKLVGDMLQRTGRFLSQHSTATKVLAGIMAGLVAITLAHNAALTVSAAGGLAKWIASTRIVTTLTKVWAAVQWALNAAMSANPITLIVIAIVALVAGLVIAYKKSETFRDIVNGAFQGVAKAAGAVFKWLSKAVGAVIGFIRSHWRLLVAILGGPIGIAVALISKHWSRIKSVTQKVWNGIRGAVSGAAHGVVAAVGVLSSIPGKVAGWFTTMKTNAVTKFTALVTFVKTIGGKVTKALAKPGQLLKDAGKKIIQGLLDGIESMVGKVKDKLNSITSWIPDWKGPASTDKKLLRPNGRLIMKGLLDGINDGVSGLRKLLKRITKHLSGKQLSGIEAAVKDTYARGLKLAAARKKVAAKLEAARQKLSDAISNSNDFRDSVTSSAIDFGSVAGTEATDSGGIVAYLQDKLAKIKKFKDNLATLLSEGIGKKAYEQLAAAGVDAAGATVDALVAGTPEAVKQVGNLTNQISDAATSLGDQTSKTLYQAGIDSAQALVNGLVTKSGKLKLAAESLARKLASEIARALGIALKDVQVPGGKGGGNNRMQARTAGGTQATGPAPRSTTRERVVIDRSGPLIGTVVQRPSESADTLAERLAFKIKSRG